MAARRPTLPPDPDTPECPGTEHRTALAYDKYGCRCPSGREAHRLYRKRRREGRLPPGFVSPLGARRMLRALAASGHHPEDVGRAIGKSAYAVKKLLRDDSDRMQPDTNRAIREGFAVISTRPGTSTRTAVWAAKYGWPRVDEWHPDDWDDPTVDPRAAATGEGQDDGLSDSLISAAKYRGLAWTSLSPDDQERVFTALRAGNSFAQIALLVGTTKSSVSKVSERINRRVSRTAAAQQDAEAS